MITALRSVAAFAVAPMAGVFTANVVSFLLFAWRAPSVGETSGRGLLILLVYVLLIAVPVFLWAGRRHGIGPARAVLLGSLCAMPAAAWSIRVWWLVLSPQTGAIRRMVVEELAIHVFAGAVSGAVFWIVAIAGNRGSIARRSDRDLDSGARPE